MTASINKWKKQIEKGSIDSNKVKQSDLVDIAKALSLLIPNVTRSNFEDKTGIPRSFVEKHFGTFTELKSAAGILPTKSERKLFSQTAKHVASDKIKGLSKERKNWGEKYLKPNKSRFKTCIIFTDVHDKYCDAFAFRVLLDTIKRVDSLDNIIIGGDLFDTPEFGKYFVDPREWDASGRIKHVHDKILSPLRKAAPKIQIDLIEGNHESYEIGTEILCKNKWVKVEDLKYEDNIASYNVETGEVFFGKPIAISLHEDAPLYSVKGQFSSESISDRHRIDVNGKLQIVKQLEGLDLSNKNFRLTGNYKSSGVGINKDYLKLITWLITDGTFRRELKKDKSGYQNKCRLQWKMSKTRKINSLILLLEKLNIDYTLKPCKKYGSNVLQPYYIRVYGESAMGMWDTLNGKKEFPKHWATLLNKEELDSILDTIEETDENRPYENTLRWTSTSFSDINVIQTSCILNGIIAKFDTIENASGFKEECKTQYCLYIHQKADKILNRKVEIEKKGLGDVVSITTNNDTAITRRNGKISFTGNSRILAQMQDNSPALMDVLHSIHGMKIADIFGLDKFEINYIAKGDLHTWTASESRKEIAKNNKIYYDSFIVDHYPQTRNKVGVPGVNGHHHKYMAYSQYNHTYGSYLWHQLGSFHVRDASYADGQPWNCGFMIAHVDTKTKQTNWEYINVTDFAVVGGKYYTRKPGEFLIK